MTDSNDESAPGGGGLDEPGRLIADDSVRAEPTDAPEEEVEETQKMTSAELVGEPADDVEATDKMPVVDPAAPQLQILSPDGDIAAGETAKNVFELPTDLLPEIDEADDAELADSEASGAPPPSAPSPAAASQSGAAFHWPDQDDEPEERTAGQEVGRGALLVISVVAPIVVGLGLLTTAVNGWFAPDTPMRLFVLFGIPICVGLWAVSDARQTFRHPFRTLLVLLLGGLGIAASWLAAPIRGALYEVVSENEPARLLALEDPSEGVAVTACIDTLSRDADSASIRRVVETLPVGALAACSRQLQDSEVARSIASRVVSEFETKSSRDVAALSCDDVDSIGALQGGGVARWGAMWSCIAQRENSALRVCCADNLRAGVAASTEVTATLDHLRGSEARPEVRDWLLAASFHGFGLDETGEKIARDLGLRSAAARRDVLRMACEESTSGADRDLLMEHVREAVGKQCHDAVAAETARELASSDWFAICSDLARNDDGDFCGATAEHTASMAVAAAQGALYAATAAHRFGAFEKGIESGNVAEAAYEASAAAKLSAIEERVERDQEMPGRAEALGTARALRSELENSERQNKGFRGFAPFGASKTKESQD